MATEDGSDLGDVVSIHVKSIITQGFELHLLLNCMLECLPITLHRNQLAQDLSEAKT